jgi:hypothetical protein
MWLLRRPHPSIQGHAGMSKERKTNFNYMAMFSFSESILLMSVRTRNMVGDARLLEKAPPVRLKCRDLLVKQSFNKILKLLEFMENFRFVLKQIDPSEFAKVINETNIIFISSNRIASKTPNIRKDEL